LPTRPDRVRVAVPVTEAAGRTSNATCGTIPRDPRRASRLCHERPALTPTRRPSSGWNTCGADRSFCAPPPASPPDPGFADLPV